MTGESIKEYLRSQLGATIKYRPPYSCDLNPIEQVFAKLKALLRKAAERTYDKLWQLIGKLLGKFRADEFPNLFRLSGYGFT